jgi:lambda family phage minor tail protein L
VKTLPSNLLLVKNDLGQTAPWILLLAVTFPDSSVIYLCNNTEDVTFQGQVYSAIPFDIDVLAQDNQGKIPNVQLRISNVTRAMQAYLEAYEGGIGASVLLSIVNTAYLTENYANLQLTLEVVGSSSDSQWVTFSLGPPNPLTKRFPPDIYMALNCRWVRNFKGVECKYAGGAATCKGTYADCQTKGNLANFGGFPGLQGGRLRVV